MSIQLTRFTLPYFMFSYVMMFEYIFRALQKWRIYKQLRHLTLKVNGGLGYPVYTRTGNVDREWHLAEISLGKEYTGGTFQVRTNIKYGRVNLVS
jgi:hypothetical protein